MPVYIIRRGTDGPLKIGYTQGSAVERLRALQTGSAERLRLVREIPGDQDLERKLHERFAAARLVGEWFKPLPSLLEWVESPCVCAECIGPPPADLVLVPQSVREFMTAALRHDCEAAAETLEQARWVSFSDRERTVYVDCDSRGAARHLNAHRGRLADAVHAFGPGWTVVVASPLGAA